ncbi:hypothetical protein HanRHA438_Chr17g0793431 [Helianthus annuus]|nr:hypothetical protein HanRHA438_Chr17g0793431 [Helianthus annuus]
MLVSSFVELISHQPSPFANLKRLKIYPNCVSRLAEDQTKPEVTMSTEVKKYLLDSAPGATLTMVSHDEHTKLPTSHRANLQERFFGLSAEAEAIMDDVMDCMKIQYDKKPSRPSVYFHELAASQPLS